MDDRYLLKKDHLKSFLRKLAKQYRLVGPLKNRHGDTRFAAIDDLDSCRLEFNEQPQNSLKQFFFPQQEPLYDYRGTGPDYSFAPRETLVEPTVYFGVRPCDVSAVLYMDVVFSQHRRDPFYSARRKKSLLIGLNCNAPFANCFCNATGNGPFLDYGVDLQMTDLGDFYYVVTGRAQGDALVERWREFFSPATDKETSKQYQRFLEARGGFRRYLHVEQAIRRLKEKKVTAAVWEELSLRCQDCGGCAFICPTCTCFTIHDQSAVDGSGVRMRSWDACTFGGFSRMAGGHNPVHQKTEAIRQRFLHKLQFDVEKHGRPSCVGCGRCVDICFGGTDIVRFIDRVCEGPA